MVDKMGILALLLKLNYSRRSKVSIVSYLVYNELAIVKMQQKVQIQNALCTALSQAPVE